MGKLNFMFVILEYTNNILKLEELEQLWLDKTKCYERKIGYNSRRLASNNLGVVLSQETKDKISKTKMNTVMSKEAKENMSKASANRNREKWPHDDGEKCKCKECKNKRALRSKENMQIWRDINREKYNSYMRDRRKRLNARFFL